MEVLFTLGLTTLARVREAVMPSEMPHGWEPRADPSEWLSARHSVMSVPTVYSELNAATWSLVTWSSFFQSSFHFGRHPHKLARSGQDELLRGNFGSRRVKYQLHRMAERPDSGREP